MEKFVHWKLRWLGDVNREGRVKRRGKYSLAITNEIGEKRMEGEKMEREEENKIS